MLAPTMKKIAPTLLILLLFLAACSPPPKPTPEPTPRPHAAAAFALPSNDAQPFDYYLLNLSWSPEFCYSHPSAAECAAHPTFVLHGL